ncbi:MAG: hypothetical protein WD770_07975 [Actinomycetota bacterium]
MNYQQAVARVRTLKTRSEADQWELARLTYEFTTGPEAETLTKWAEDCGFSQPHATNLRKVWMLFGLHKGPNDRQGLSFNECYSQAMVSKERRQELTRRARREGRSVSTIRDQHRRKREVEDLRDALVQDPEFRRKVFEDPEVRKNFEEIFREEDRQREGMTREEARIVAELRALNARLLELLDQMLDTTLTKQERKEILERVHDIQETLVWMTSHAKDGTRSFEDALDALLADTPPAKPITPPKRRRRRPPPAAESPNGAAPLAEPRRGQRRRIPDRSIDPTKRPSRKRRAG